MSSKPDAENLPKLSASALERPPDNYLQLVEEDLLTTFRFKLGSLQYSLMRALFKKPLFHFTEFLLELDEHLVNTNVASMAQLALQRLTLGVSLHGEPKIPSEGPALIITNHPGWIDGFVALAGITRPDVYFLAGSHPTLENLPHFKKHLIFVNEQGAANRAEVIRTIIAQLKAGKAVVMCPKGLLEPDPALIPGAAQSILDWNDSVGIFLAKVPETILQPMLISQMVHPQAWNHWVIKKFKEQRRRQQLATVLQFALSLRKKNGHNWKVNPRVDFGAAVSGYALSVALNPREISRNLKELMLSLLTEVYPKQA